MSNNDDSLQLYLKLDEVTDGKVIDHSGKGQDGTIVGELQFINIDNDEFLGECLEFNGQSNHIDLPNTVIPVGDEITISFWANNGGESLPKHTSIIYGQTNTSRIINIHLPWSDNKIYFDCGNDGIPNNDDGYSFDRVSKEASPSDFQGKWSYWTFTKNAKEGKMKIYLNGQLWHSSTGKTKPIKERSNNVQLARYLSNDIYRYVGKLAHFRIYNRALSQQEINQDMALSIVPGLEEKLNELQSLQETWTTLKESIDDLNMSEIPDDIQRILATLQTADETRQILTSSAKADRSYKQAEKAAQEAEQFAQEAQTSADEAYHLYPASMEAQDAQKAAEQASEAARLAKKAQGEAQTAVSEIKVLTGQVATTPNSESETLEQTDNSESETLEQTDNSESETSQQIDNSESETSQQIDNSESETSQQTDESLLNESETAEQTDESSLNESLLNESETSEQTDESSLNESETSEQTDESSLNELSLSEIVSEISAKAEIAEAASVIAVQQRNIAEEKAKQAVQYAQKAGENYDNWETISNMFELTKVTTDDKTEVTTDGKNASNGSDTQSSPDAVEYTPLKYDNWQVVSDLFGLTVNQNNSEVTQTQSSATEETIRNS